MSDGDNILDWYNGNINNMTSTTSTITDKDGSTKKTALASAQGYCVEITISTETVNSSATYDALKKNSKYLGSGWYPLKTWFVNKGAICSWRNGPNIGTGAPDLPLKPTINNSTALWDVVDAKLCSTFNRVSTYITFGGRMGANDSTYVAGEDNCPCVVCWGDENKYFDDYEWQPDRQQPICFLRDAVQFS